MRFTQVITDRGVDGIYTLPEHRETDADDFGGESETLRPGHSVA